MNSVALAQAPAQAHSITIIVAPLLHSSALKRPSDSSHDTYIHDNLL